MDDDVGREFETYGSEVPDGLDASLDHFVGDVLRVFSRRGDDAEMNSHALSEVGEILEREHSLAVDALPDLFGICIECSNDAETKVGEALVPEEGGAEVAAADEESVVNAFPAEKGFDGKDEFRDGITGFGLANDAGVLEVFAHLDGDEIQVGADDAAGDASDSSELEPAQIVMVLG